MEWFLTIRADAGLLERIDRLVDLLQQMKDEEDSILSTLQDNVDAIAAQTTAIGSLTTFVTGLQAQIAAIPGIPAAQQAQIDAVFKGLTANTASIMAAMAINVPPPPPPPTVVPPVVVPAA